MKTFRRCCWTLVLLVVMILLPLLVFYKQGFVTNKDTDKKDLDKNWFKPRLAFLPISKNTGLPDSSLQTSREQETSPRTHGVPKIIHQIWTDDILPTEFVDNVKGLVRLNPTPEWKYYFWPQRAGQKLLERKYPSLLPFYKASDNTQKADILRILVIHQFGGVYFDLDTVGVKPLKPFVENTSCSVVTVTPEQRIDKDMIVGVDLISNNALFCRPFHPYFSAIVQLLEKQPITCMRAIQCTGPFFISHVYYEMMKNVDTHVLLPRIENYKLFQDKIATGSLTRPEKVCSGQNYLGAEVWRRAMCDEWTRRGKSRRNISEMAYTYHTWFHVRTNRVTKEQKNVISNIVPHVFIYN